MAAMKSERLIPPARLPILRNDGTIDSTWYKFFERVNREIGGDGFNLIDGNVIDIVALNNELTSLADVSNQNANDITAINSQITAINLALVGINNELVAIAAAQGVQDAAITANTAHRNNAAVHVPAGGAAGEQLTKTSATDGDTAWAAS